MPDTHEGKGSVIGFTFKLNEYVVPNVVGVDIGCGMLSYNLGKAIISLEKIDDHIKRLIPSGRNIRLTPDLLWNNYEDLLDQVNEISDKLNIQKNYVINSIGSLGGGNHFIEIGSDPDDNKWVTIHSGSRNFGLQVCNYYQKRAKELMKKMFVGSGYKDLEFLPIEEKSGKDYLHDMMVAQQYAKLNRLAMLRTIGIILGLDINFDETIESIHNYISPKDNIIRKGATSAHNGEKVIIPFNMRDGIAMCTGKGNFLWNCSAPHGAGRIYSRRKAKEEISLHQYKSQMEGIYSSCINEKTLDESPGAYKDKDSILKAIEETVEINFLIKPIYNFKGY